MAMDDEKAHLRSSQMLGASVVVGILVQASRIMEFSAEAHL